MKKFVTLVAFLFVAVSAFSQDLITTRAGEDIEAEVIEVGPDYVRYLKVTQPEGPVFIMPVSDILMIRYENGEKSIFTDVEPRNARGEVRPGMKYREYENLYSPQLYRREPGDPYSRGWAAVGSVFITGLGQGIDGEWLRGLAFFGGAVACNTLAWSTANYYSSEGNTRIEFTGVSGLASLASLGIYIWSIVDAVRVAKIKNMYFQDIHGRRAMLDFKVEPFVASTPVGISDSRPVAGLAFRLNF